VRSSSAKNLAKRWSRRLFAAGSRALALGRSVGAPGVRILTYHRIAADPGDPFAVAPKDFVLQMEAIARTGRVVDLGTALNGLRAGGGPVSQIVVSFDDGTRDFLTEAAPVLSRLGIPSVIYVNPSCVGGTGFLGWNELLDLSRAGVEVGSHSLEHRSLGPMSQAEVRRQVVESRRMLQDRLGREVNALAYPYGTLRDFSPMIQSEVASAGYRSACTAINGLNRPGADPMTLRRTKIEQWDMGIFPWILAGALDGWAFIDRHLASIQNRYA